MKERIKEIIVVEGKNDTNVLQSYFDCDTIETGGDQILDSTIKHIKEAKKTRDIIIFTDPDTPGEHIRRWIDERVPGCKHAFIEKKKARTEKKVGVEHASKEDLWDALCHCVTFEKNVQTLSWNDFVELGLTGFASSHDLRNEVCQYFHIGPCNAKTCFKRLNQLSHTKEEIQKVMKGESF